LTNAGANIDFGANGANKNGYNEKYNTYLWDQFEKTNSLWAGTFGKNIYNLETLSNQHRFVKNRI
jgi:hypothetical protein